MSKHLGIPYAVVFILFVELCERFCFYTIQGTQKFYLSQSFSYTNAQSTSIVTVFNTACYLCCIAGGILGDCFLGRFQTIACLSCLYALGTFAVALSTHPAVSSQSLFFLGSFAGIAVGTGGIKPLVCNFGADQIVGEDAAKSKERFFSFFYWMINVGAALALGIMATVATSPQSFGIMPGYGYFTSYGVGAIAMFTATFVFISCSRFYVTSVASVNVKVFQQVCCTLMYSAGKSVKGAVCLFAWLLLVPFFVLSFLQAFTEQGSGGAEIMARSAFAIAVVQLGCLITVHCNNTFLVEPGQNGINMQYGIFTQIEASADNNGPATIEEIQMTFQSAPLLIISNMIFSFASTMMVGPFLSQSCQMNLHVGSGQVSGAFFNLANCLAIILFIPIVETLLYPFAERLLGRKVAVSEKLMAGFTMAALAMLSAIALELHRRSALVVAPPGWSASGSQAQRFPGMSFSTSGPNSYASFEPLMGRCIVGGRDYCSNCAPLRKDLSGSTAGIYMSDISGFWMFIPFAFIGLGEVLINPVLYYYAYSMAPPKTQSIVQAFNLVFQGAYPPALVGVFSTVLANQQPFDLNLGRLELFYYITLVIIVLGTVLFFCVLEAVKLQSPSGEVTETEKLLSSDANNLHKHDA